MQFKPGDPLDDVESWKEAGFTDVSWNRVKGKNQLFLSEVRAGRKFKPEDLEED